MLGSSLALFTCIAVAAAARSLIVKASGPEVVWDVSHFDVSTRIINTGDETLRLLNDPRTPLSPFATNSFVVTNSNGLYPSFNGARVQYLPHIVARRSGEGSLFTVLAPGEFVDVLHEGRSSTFTTRVPNSCHCCNSVGRYYNFTSSGPGSYTFIPVNIFNVLEDDGSVGVIAAEIIPATARISGKLFSDEGLGTNSLGGVVLVKKRAIQFGKRINFMSCDAAWERADLNTAASDSDTACLNAVTYLHNNPRGSDLETTWFGTFDQTRHQKILNTLQVRQARCYPAVKSLEQGSDLSGRSQSLVGAFTGWTYDCSCSNSQIYAYVVPTEYGTVYLCAGFWPLGSTGDVTPAGCVVFRLITSRFSPDFIPSPSSTLIRMGTHFRQVGNTGDSAFGEQDCKKLARDSPDGAVSNGDNYALFAAAVGGA